MAEFDSPLPTAARAPLRARAGAVVSLLLERVWPVLMGLAALVAAFLTLAWFGLFAALPFVARLALLALFAAAGLWLLWRARGLRWPSGGEVVRRIEAESRLLHQPLAVQSDRAASEDPFALALWREHQRRMREHLSRLRGGSPQTRTYRLDPLGLRALLAALLVTAFAYSFGPGGGRVADALRGGEVPLLVAARIDAWATPPGYTGRAPIFLTGETEGRAPLDVPQGTILSLRLSDGEGTKVIFAPDGGEAETLAPIDPAVEAAGEAGESAPTPATATAAAAPVSAQYELPLGTSGMVRVETALRTLRDWRFAVLPDQPPTIRFDGEPKAGRNNTLDIAFAVTDDYGASAGKALLQVREPVAPGARPLVPVPEVTLAMPRRTKGEAKGRTGLDLTESPYAGAKVAMVLQARDDAGQIGESAPVEVTLPQRRFNDPLARAVIEQRRILALDANAARRVVDMLDAVTLRGDEFIAKPTDYLALRAARERINKAHDDETLLSAVDFLWSIALGIEEGGLSVAERALRDAQEKLAEALRNNAGEEEIARLTQELREAMQQYMQAMMEAMRNMPPQSQSQMGEAQEIRPQDLDRMLDRIEDLARSGSRDAAQQLLSELNQMMQSLQAMRQGQQGQQGQQAQSPMQQQMNQLGEMLQRQQKLMDETFEMGRQQMRRQMEAERGMREPQPGEEGEQGQQGPPQAGEEGQAPTAEQLQALKDRLQKEQGQLQKDLQALQDAMKGQGMQPSQDFGQAGESMGRAEGALGQGDDGEAVGQQGDAMAALRRGAQDAMRQMQQAMGQGEGQGQGQQPGQQQGQGRQPGQGQMGQGYGPGRQRTGLDPLGRERQTEGPDFGSDVGVPDEIDIQRARRILDQIRDRLGRQLSPQEERDYLERLLRTP